MKKTRFKIVFFALLGFGLTINAQQFTDTLFYNRYQEKVESPDSNGFYRVISIDSTSNFQFLVKDFYANGQLKMSGTFRSLNPDKMNGTFKYYYSNGTLYKQCKYANNILSGSFKLWYENGKPKQECTYLNDNLSGIFKSWSEEGILVKNAEFTNGKKNGKFITYYKNGNPIRIEKYKNDELVKAKCYTATGRDTAYFIYFTPPSFSGGDVSTFTQWVMNKLQYPDEALKKLEEGEVKVKFTVDKQGKVEGIQITKLDRPYFNSEVIRVITSSPLWKPARRDTDTVDVSVEIPIKFKLPKIQN
jgi:TonB family protein